MTAPATQAPPPPVPPVQRVRLLEPLQQRDFRLLWTGMALSLFGDGVLLGSARPSWPRTPTPSSPSPRGGSRPAERLPYRVSGVLEHTADGWRRRLCTGAEPAAA